MGNICIKKEPESVITLFNKRIEERKIKINPEPPSALILYHIERDKILLQEDSEKPPITYQNYNIDDNLKIPKINPRFKEKKEDCIKLIVTNQKIDSNLKMSSKEFTKTITGPKFKSDEKIFKGIDTKKLLLLGNYAT